MKKLITIAVAFLSILLITAQINIPLYNQSTLKSAGVSKPISDKVMKIVKKSCGNCHSEPGNGMALAHINLTNWDKYSPEKQAAKAKTMCNMVSKGKMPPKNFREKHPDGISSKEEIKTICEWAQ